VHASEPLCVRNIITDNVSVSHCGSSRTESGIEGDLLREKSR
jgi:hypothetical protein